MNSTLNKNIFMIIARIFCFIVDIVNGWGQSDWLVLEIDCHIRILLFSLVVKCGEKRAGERKDGFGGRCGRGDGSFQILQAWRNWSNMSVGFERR